ncbi:FtsX-like permease family protein [Streptomyces sp. NBC_01288]|uniref:FtsX-like permease family protein n=1 Tax=Streptomyces sp. NBC_01288 TaxID=2903814 RepID=UPI002E0E94D9|nr:FtsX-like permease family protein [Streptomyces sp. NBC_01288]
MSALSRVIRSGMARRRVQTLVIGLATMLAVTASVLGGALLMSSEAPFDKAFDRQNGAQLTAQFDARMTTAAQLADSAKALGVTATSGPFPTATVTPGFDGQSGAPLSVAGRSTPGGEIDKMTMTKGRWVKSPGEIVLSADTGPEGRLGRKLEFPDLPGSPTLTVVGVARSVSRTADAWVLPSQIAELTLSGKVTGYQMLYRFTHADTSARMSRDREAITATTPANSLTGAQSWLGVKKVATRETALFVPFLVAFGVLGLVMSVLIVGNVVAGAVATGRRRIGILKAVGCTPGQVVRACAGQALIPAAVGAALGTAAGHLLAAPVLSDTADAYGTAGLGVELWVDVAVIGGVLGLVTLTACASAWRAGRLRAVDALAVGRTPGVGRWRRTARLAARLPVSRAVGLGLARPFARPARAVAMVVAVLFGVAAVIFAVGLSSSLGEVIASKNHNAADVTVSSAVGPGQAVRQGQPTSADPTHSTDPATVASITAAIAAQPGTRASYGSATTDATVSGMSGPVTVTAFDGDASWGGYTMVSGRWFTGAGEAVVPSTVLTATGAKVGDTVTLTVRGKAVEVRIVGEVFDTGHDGRTVLTDAATLKPAVPGLNSTTLYVDLKPGTDLHAYVTALNTELKPLGVTASTGKSSNGSGTVNVLDSLTALLTLMLVCVAGLGVLGGVVLDTHERVHDLGIHKALGMTPRQTVTMVVTSVVLPGLAGGALGVPLGLAVHGAVIPAMGHAAGLRLPRSVIEVYDAQGLVLLGLAGVGVAVLGSLLPAGWAARIRTATALRAE